MTEKKSPTSKGKEYLRQYFQSERGKEAIKKYAQSEKGKTARRNVRKRNHAKYRDKDNAASKKAYEENPEYYRQKRKEHYKKNGDKWRKRRAEISKEFSFNKCTPIFAEAVFNSLGATLTIDRTLNFEQFCALVKVLGYDLDDVTYPPFVNRLRYFRNKKTP